MQKKKTGLIRYGVDDTRIIWISMDFIICIDMWMFTVYVAHMGFTVWPCKFWFKRRI